MTEQVCRFGDGKSLVGIVTQPERSDHRQDLPAIMFLNAGLLHRVGPQRLYVKMARHLASRGFAVLRFDFSGIGDSEPRTDRVPFPENRVAETQQAMDHLSLMTGATRFLLMGICGGAFISYKAACQDTRVAGAVMISPLGVEEGGREALWQYAASREVFRSLLKPRSWIRALSGKSNYRGNARLLRRRVEGLFRKQRLVAEASAASATLSSLLGRGADLFVVYPGGHYWGDYLKTILGKQMHEATATGKLNLKVIDEANHVFSAGGSHGDLQTAVDDWLERYF